MIKTNTQGDKEDLLNYRYDILPFPNAKRFYNLLHDRLHMVLDRFLLEHPFTIFLTVLPRDKMISKIARQEIAKQDFISGGIETQRRFLEKDTGSKENTSRYWTKLNRTKIKGDSEGTVSSRLYDEYTRGDLDLEDITAKAVGPMRQYFSSLSEEDRTQWHDDSSTRKQAEYHIINEYLSIDAYWYLSVPLIQFAEFDGVAHIVMHSDDMDTLLDGKTNQLPPKVLSRLINAFINEYEGLVLDWDLVEGNSDKMSALANGIDIAYKLIDVGDNKLIEQLNLGKYYEKHYPYYADRVEISNAIPTLLYEQHLKNAITIILLDSYAHNISAHSLTTLSWWFRERSKYLAGKESRELLEDFGRDTNPLILYSKYYKTHTLSKELFPLFKFLLEKGAFWSGITRETNRIGKNSNMFNILWFDFINNPLYLGTIANTEEIFKLHVAITIYESEEERSGSFENVKRVKEVDGVLLDDVFVTINLEDFEEDKPSNPDRSVFVEEGKHFELIKKELKGYKAFFPGGVVGKHAFFTLLENEVRNVKHYKGDDLAAIQRDGLVLNISIHERPAYPEKDGTFNQLYKIGVWLKHPVQIDNRLLIGRIKDLGLDIVTENTYHPKLGGNYQDKICAAMLMEGTFEAVQHKETPIGEIYYPWIKTASYPLALNEAQEAAYEVELSYRKFTKLADGDVKDEKARIAKATEVLSNQIKQFEGLGYLKKYFHLWKGADVLKVDTEQAIEVESPARFRFVCVDHEHNALAEKLKSQGLVRVLRTTDCPSDLTDAYQNWLPVWLKSGKEGYVVNFMEGETLIGRLLYQNGQVQFKNKAQIEKVEQDDTLYFAYKRIPNKLEIKVAHGGKTSTASDKVNYRSHGRLINSFCEGKLMSQTEKMPPEKASELFEAITTRITLFDRRLYNRLHTKGSYEQKRLAEDKLKVQQHRLEVYRNSLLLDFRTEVASDWEVVKQQGLLDKHFLLMHLSFIESMKDAKGEHYRENRIIDFIDEQILQGRNPKEVGDNFILAITTGRGRMAWWDTIEASPEYARFVTFRPIESIIAAVENALQISDDFDLKYNLTKLLFGS